MHPHHEHMLRPLHPQIEIVRRRQHRAREVPATDRGVPVPDTKRTSRRHLAVALPLGAAGGLAAILLAASLG